MKQEKKKTIVLSVALFCLGIVLFLTSGRNPTELTATEIERNEPGKGSKSMELSATIKDIHINGIDVMVAEREYTIEECESLFDECKDKIIKAVLSTNADLSKVTDDLDFVKEIKGYPFYFEYETDSPDKIGSEGTITSKQ